MSFWAKFFLFFKFANKNSANLFLIDPHLNRQHYLHGVKVTEKTDSVKIFHFLVKFFHNQIGI